ncbi:MAG: 3'-to-5' oligoribonuclease B, partial [Campylobacterales bacterium]|nr:3'-to-5' oligoribonuclease B [Campylobacterales bacterium]
MRLFHLSHTDLDGYGCQYVASKYAKNARFFNSNYGNEINARLKQMTA